MAKGVLLGRGVLWDELSVGAWFHTAGRTITEADLCCFCNLTWLTEELFTNVADRADMAIPGRVVPGALVYSFAEGLLTPFMQGTGLAFLHAELDVRQPTFVGDTIHLECEVQELRTTSKPDRGLVRTANHVVTQRGDTVLRYTPLRLLRGHHRQHPGRLARAARPRHRQDGPAPAPGCPASRSPRLENSLGQDQPARPRPTLARTR